MNQVTIEEMIDLNAKVNRIRHQRVDFLKGFFEYLKKNCENDWCMKVCRDKNQNCLIGHITEYCGVEGGYQVKTITESFQENIMNIWDLYAVNDGKVPNYPQPTPRQRCLAFILDLISGKVFMTHYGTMYDVRISDDRPFPPKPPSKCDAEWAQKQRLMLQAEHFLAAAVLAENKINRFSEPPSVGAVFAKHLDFFRDCFGFIPETDNKGFFRIPYTEEVGKLVKNRKILVSDEQSKRYFEQFYGFTPADIL